MSFNIIQPSLIQQLKTILDQYPDDGQILKELIQNAEDAEASQVKFLHDKHSYGTEKLHSKGLAQFQGPAIYAYNNAEFTPDDWEGIRMLCDSKKIKDPMKVGRFGLGFKSVFHVTDLPSIISNSQIGVIDPHEQCFGDRTTGYSWQMKEDRATMDKIPDQFTPYKGVFNCTDEVFSNCSYNGTLFRFPLRTKPSELSQTLYSAEKVHTLFEGFTADAHLVLLFLQHLESVELYVREESDTEPRKTFQVRITEESLQLVRDKRREFQSKISTGQLTSHTVDVTYPITIETVDLSQEMENSTCRHSFLVTNYFCGGEVSSEFRTLATDEDLSYLPLVGVAMALPASSEEPTPAVQGHVFCFLPLPVQKTSLTGLPVHVNGFFALSQNRRYIKSPNAEQEDQEKAGHQLTDKSLLWNKCLLEEAIPKAYATMILTAVNEKSYKVQAEAIYKAWPDVKRINQKWERIAKPLLQILIDKEIVYTEANRGKWLTVGKAFFNQLPENQTKELLQRVLLAANFPIVSVPRHVTEAITPYTAFNEITAHITRLVLKKAPACYKKRDRREKLLLLHFCLQDCDFDELCDLELLPLSNGTFTTFSNRSDPIYICSPEHPRELLPGLQHRFLDDTVDEDITRKLKEAAQQECTQLRLLSKDDVAVLLRQALPSEWSKGKTVIWYPDDRNHNHPPKDWIKLVWRYLRDHFISPRDIQRLGNVPLIPISMSQKPVTLTRLCHPSTIIVKCLDDDVVDDALAHVLTKLGLIVLNDCPTFISYHPALLGTFVHRPSVQGVLKAMVNSASEMVTERFSEIIRREMSTKEKHVLRAFLTNIRPVHVGKEEYNLLSSLPVFETLSKRFVSKNEGLRAAPVEPLPIPLLHDLVDISQEDSKSLTILLKLKILKPTELLCELIFPDIHQGKYSEEHIDKLMPYVLKNFAHVIRGDVNFKRNIQTLSFVPKESGRVKASDLFDPRNDTLKKIFVFEDIFPVGELYNDTTVLVILEELGMKSERNIASKDLYQSAKLVSMLPHSPPVRRKSNAILNHLSIHPQKLNKSVNGQQLGALLRGICWVPRLQQRTSNFPPSLPWGETENDEERHFFKPTELKSHQMINLIGTVKPVVDIEPSNDVSSYFGWQKKPDVFDVVEHLQNVVTCYTKDEKAHYMVLVNEIYSFLSSANYADVTRALRFSLFYWIWNGDGFSSPNHVLSSKPPIDLTPYILPLPSEMKKHFDFFHRFGMRTQSDPALLLQVLGMIKEKYEDKTARFDASEVRHDLQLSVDILNEVAGENLSPEDQAKIPLPVHHVEETAYVRLEPVDRCMYCEHKEWLKREGEDEDLEDQYFYVHSNVPNITAKRLGVPSQTYRMLDAEDLFIGEEFGQEEKLTTRLSRLLEDYKDGFAVLKELVQNADDAGATEVKFLYDERTNEDSMTCLIDEGMRSCQGPALWVYNDATFKDEDFVNITKLNEATKVHDTEKIGRFGLGFNAVYNLTDVPMFVSKNYFAIFDPHESHLRKRGIKIDLNKDAKSLQKFKNQFKPFNGIFGCDLHLENEDNSFGGTLFRFPLRTREQAAISEIKKLCYDDQEMRELLKMFLDRATSLLLFTQNVFRVGIYNLPRPSSQNPQPVLMFQVTKSFSEVGILRELSVPVTLPVTAKKLDAEQRRLLKQCNFLQASSKVTRDAKNHKVNPSEFPESSIAVNVECTLTNSGANFFKMDERLRQECETWLVVSSMGNGKAMQFAKSDLSLLPSAGVAVQLVSTESDTILPSPGVDGTIFCYLPLPIHSGLPVHINGAFAVSSNRRHLQGKLEDDKTCFGDEWNKVLMRDSISTAYLCLLEDVKNVVPDDGSYVFHSLWPQASQVRPDCWSILTSFYEQLARGSHALFSDGNEWVGITQVVFLHPDLRMDPEIGEISFAVFQDFPKENDVVIDLPAEVFQSFDRCGLWNVIENKTYDKIRFFSDVFFQNISNVRSDLRDVLVLNALNHNHKEFDELIMKHACIPASPVGKTLKRPSQLVHPNKEAASLFCPDDGRFPFGNENTFRNRHLLTKQEELGMKSNDLPWEDIAERAESIRRVNSVDSKAAVKRVKVLLEFLQKKMKRKRKGPSDVVLARLLEAEFLPVLQKPTSFPLPWKSEEFQSRRRLLAAPKDIFLKEKKYLVCCSELLVDPDIPKKVTELLRLEDKNVTAEHVLKQLEEAISTNIDVLDRKGYEEVSRVCTETYSFLQDNIASCTSSVKHFLLTKSFILVGKRFLSANHVAFEIKTDCFPYLYKLPDDLSDDFSKLMKFSGVRKQFEEKDYISSLQDVKGQFDKMRLDERTLHVAVNMAIQLGETLERSDSNPCKVQEKLDPVYLPDSRGIMRAVPDLCYKDCPWMPDDPDEQFVHETIPWSTCEHLGVKTRRDEALQHHDAGFPFGQKEELTNRLKRILTGYPGEKEILKELLQNADDAQATEICFIKDPRHHPNKRVFNDSWKPLQGPALCVYNNQPFTNADIEGICNLGKGSKGEDPNKTGQYGVGFNAVYHLTDVPSFRSNGEEIGDVLCVFDPHCKYVPCASDAEPGRMYKDIENLKTKFLDVFPCYLEEHFPINNATMFRFPLKSEKMAEESKISQTPVTVKKLDAMIRDLKQELFEVLLFVNNVRKVSISAIDKSGKLVNTYSVEVVMSQEDDRERQAFALYMKEIGKQAKQKDFVPTSIKVKKCTYTLRLRDSCGKEETWLIVQQVGFEKPAEKSIVDAFKDHQLGMLPRGGVACLLKSNRSRSPVQEKKKAYCFLPLPFETNLPVHINGHFALDHEARRNLWRDAAGGYRSDWNNALLRDVIASCYLTLLDKVRGFLQLPVLQDGVAHTSTFSRNTISMRLFCYEKLFPSYPFEDPHWRTLVDSVYQEMSNKEMRLIPVLRSLEGSSSSSAHAKDFKGSEGVQVTWFPPTDTGRQKTYFNNLNMKGRFAALPPRRDIDEKEIKRREESRIKWKNKFEETLLETGLNLVALSFTVFDSFTKAGVEVCCVSPSAVMDFYKSFSDADPLCNVGQIPCPINKTPFRNQEGLIRVLKYCKDDAQFLENLPGLPLLLTQDNYLRLFSASDPRCLSHYTDILPGSPSLFVHTRVRSEVFIDVDFKKVTVFQPLDVQIFSSQLHLTLPGCFRSEDHCMRWCPNDSVSNLPNRRWIYRVWNFLQGFASATMKKLDVSEENKIAFIRDLLSPLSKWCILPATETNQLESPQMSFSVITVPDHFLVPLKKAESVIDFFDCGKSNETLVEALRKLSLPELNKVVITTMSFGTVSFTKKESYEFARNLVATIKTPHSLLIALKQKLKINARSLDERLKNSEAVIFLDYFSRNTNALTDADRDTLTKLPFFPRASGGLEKLEGKDVFVLPDEIPKDGMDVVESRLGCLVLASDQRLTDLYKFLEFHQVSPAEVYLKLVLKCFQHLGLEVKLAHLQYLRNFISLTSEQEKENEQLDKERLLAHLKMVEFIPTLDGSLKTASSFYDPDNDVFRTMLPEDSFPPKPFNSDEWLPFLEKIGFVKDVSQDAFLKFATHVASEAETARTEKTYEKSEVLVRHLISRRNVVDEGLLHLVRDIPFVAADPVQESLQALCSPFGETEDDEIPFIAFKGTVVSDYEEIVWTKAHLLPRRADPRHSYELGCSHQNIEQYLNDFLTQLHVQQKPSVDLVISHCQTVSERRHVPDKQCSRVIMVVMERIYKFLQQNAIKSRNAKMLLQATRCILVEGGKAFILPRQAVLELYERLEIKPFLYRVPPKFGKFQPLFEFLGCSKTVTCIHYAMVLEMLQKNCKDAKLHPNDVHTCSKAVRGFFDSLQEDAGALSTLSKLYLPAMPPGCSFSNTPLENNTIPITLHQSTELVFDDAPTYSNRIQGLNQRFVLELRLMEVTCKSTMINYKDLMMKLPLALQPRMLSSVVQEKLSDPDNTKVALSGAVNELKQKLSSVQFCHGIARIVRHVNSQTKGFDERVITSIERGLRSIELLAVESLITSLFHDEISIPGSELVVPHFQEKLETSGGEIWRVYINAMSGMDDTISTTSLVTDIIVEVYGEFLGKKAFIISDMLRCPPWNIWSLLDNMRIRKDDSYNAAQMDIYPEPGTLIPIEDHHLLNDAFEEFEAGEYVGYQLDDPSLDLKEGAATYIYAIIVEEVTNEDAGVLTKEYRINIGHNIEPVVVNAASLHTFHRLNEIFDDQEECHRNREEVLNEISDNLEKAWELPEDQEDERVQIVQRLFLSWFPKENVANKELYKAASQHIKNEVSRLGGSYDALFAYWEALAREHEHQRKTYLERFRRKYGPWQSSSGHRSWHVPPSFCTSNSQPQEAKRWFRQAEADLEAGAKEIAFSSDSYEWACFKCHQAAEKALKAVQYNTDANQKTNDHNLCHNCCGFDDPELTDLAIQLEGLVVNSAHMRYPDTMSYPKIPNDVYTAKKAEKALTLATKVLERVKCKLN